MALKTLEKPILKGIVKQLQNTNALLRLAVLFILSSENRLFHF